MIGGIIQARCGSTRLPHKILKEVGSMTVLEHLVKQVRGARKIDKLILATSDESKDDDLAEHAAEIGLSVYRGDEQKIMTRLLNAALMFDIHLVVRLLGDCPLTDPQIIDEFIEIAQSEPSLDMITNQNPHTYPDGYDISVIRIESLIKLCRDFEQSGKNEHLSGFWNFEGGYKFRNITADKNYFHDYRVTLDYPKDLEVIESIILGLNGNDKILHLRDVLEYLGSHPNVSAINKEYIE